MLTVDAGGHGKPVILVTAADLASEALALLGDYQVVYAGRQADEAALVALCAQYQPVAIIVRYGRITPAVIAASATLRVISKHGSGIDTIDVVAAKSRGIAVRAATAVNAAAVAEHTWALILDCTKSVSHLNKRMHAGHWDKSTHKSMELEDRTLGLVGLGTIGRRVAAIGNAIGMRVLGFDPYAREAVANVTPADLPELLRSSDIVSLHCPLAGDNRQMINAATLASMRRGAILINTARGGLVDEQAVRDALESGQLAAAGLDTFETEPPPPDHLLCNTRGLTMTPHIGGVTDAAYVSMGVAAARNILAECRPEHNHTAINHKTTALIIPE
jgi:D-3-phosphoglycerate dehydrogenase